MKGKRWNLLVSVVACMLIMLSGCQQSEQSEPTEPHEHVYGQWAVTTEATCTAQGEETRTCECGEKVTRSTPVAAHTYDSGEITTAATCQETGVKTYTCTGCGETKTETVKKLSHNYGTGEITTAATCQNAGTKTFTCANCGATKTETIAKLSHSYNSGAITTQATCQNNGVKTFTCNNCGTTRTETIAKLGHSPNSKNICTRCGIECPIELNLTAAEKTEAQKVAYISERSIDNLEEEKQFRLMFSLTDSNKNWLKVPVVVTIKITNDSGTMVYKASKVVKTSDYGGWSNGFGKQWTAAAIYIPYADITPGTVDKGTVSFEVYNDYVSFDTSTLTISRGLPVKATNIIIPSLPKTFNDYSYDGSISSSVKITGVTYEVSGEDLYIYFTGEKTYDQEGSRYSSSCKVGWKLYDSDGYIVDSGTFYSPQIAVGEKFRNEKEYAWDVIKPGTTYRLELSNVD